MKRYIIVVLIMGILSVPSLSLGMSSPKSVAAGIPAFHPVFTAIQGVVKVKSKRYSVWEPAEVGNLILSGDVIKTGSGAKAEISFASGDIRIYENTVIEIPTIGQHDRKKDIQDIFIDNGSGLFNIRPLGVKRGFEFQTRYLQGGVKGTFFAVKTNEKRAMVAVFRGEVEVSDMERSPESKTTLSKGQGINVYDGSGFGEVRNFESASTWETLKDENDLNMGAIEMSKEDFETYENNKGNMSKGVKDRGLGEGSGRSNGPQGKVGK